MLINACNMEPLTHCDIPKRHLVQVCLYFQVTADPSGIGFDLDVPVEVVIGSIPLASIAQQYGLNIPTTIEPPPAGAPAGLYGDASLPNIRKCWHIYLLILRSTRYAMVVKLLLRIRLTVKFDIW